MNLFQFQGAVELGLIYGLVSIGVYLSFRVLQFPDLSVDGTFPLGAAVCAALISKGINPFLAVSAAVAAGALFGWITAFLSNSLKMLNLLAGILTMSALYSINLRVMGNKPNISLLGDGTVFSSWVQLFPPQFPTQLFILFLLVALVGGSVVLFLRTEMGLGMRAAGGNARMARAQGIDDRKMISLGLALSNGCVALSGALFAQIFGFADVTLGVGTIIIGLASVIIGEAVLPARTNFRRVLACILGAIAYRLLISIALNLDQLGLQASDLNLITAVLVTAAMNLPKIRSLVTGRLRAMQTGEKR